MVSKQPVGTDLAKARTNPVHSLNQPCWFILGVLGFLFLLVPEAHAERIGDLVETNLWDQAARFFTFQDPLVRTGLIGCALLGVCCGLLGTFIVVRQFALVGDTLAHAVLPGIALGYLWTMTKSPLPLFIGAVIAGIIGAVTVTLIRQTTKTKQDTALGIVLGGFYGIGILIISILQATRPSNISGLKSFLFGSAAAMNESDLWMIGFITALSVVILVCFFGQFKAVSFDGAYARSIGIPAQFFHYLLMLLLAWAVVAALQAVGVVLVSAMLIIPAATAYLLTDRLHWMLLLSMLFGVIVASIGAFLSFLGPNLPTGPFIVLTASVLFAVAFLFAPKYGVVPKWWRRRRQTRQIMRENTLKAIYHLLEADDFSQNSISRDQLVDRRDRDSAEVSREILSLVRHELIEIEGDKISFTPDGKARAEEIVRNHRLWELYLTDQANIAPDHVHDDAEKIEHILPEDVVRQLEKALDEPTVDPHGKEIPAVAGKRK
ncbi:MAG: iron chelate uptake ABC transporter family permease subunit [Verrucomicrobiales bacterium]|nr:iron chelate uptake ABC transporter family permease subunit [Verrucomicrobiales bacterium]